MNFISSSALDGLHRAQLQLQAAASNTARMSVDGAKAERAAGDKIEQTNTPVDLATDTVTILSAKTQFRATLAVIKTQDQTAKSLLNLVG